MLSVFIIFSSTAKDTVAATHLQLTEKQQVISNDWTISAEAEKKIKFFEGGPYLKSYKGAGGHWLIGWGHNCGHQDLSITINEANKIFWQDIKRCSVKIKKDIKVQLTPNQFSVLVDLYFNMGGYALKNGTKVSTLITELNKGNYKLAGEEILKYVNVTYFDKKENRKKKRSLPGLVKRRKWGFGYWNK